MKKLILVSLILLSSQMAMAVNWVEMPSDGRNGRIMIDVDSVKKHYFSHKSKRFYLTAWIKRIYPNIQIASNGKSYNISREFMYFDCENRKSMLGEIINYYNSDNQAVESGRFYVNTTSSSDWGNVVPETAGEARLHLACDAYEIGTKYGYQF